MRDHGEHSLEAERAVLGALLLSERAMYGLAIEEGLRADDFYSQQHRHIFAAMRALYDAGQPMDRLSVRGWLDQNGQLHAAGGDAALDELGTPIAAVGNVRQYARTVREHSMARGLTAATIEATTARAERKVPLRQIIDGLSGRLADLVVDTQSRGRLIAPAVAEGVERIAARKRRNAITGVPTGLTELDAALGGLQKSKLYIVAARPGMGKSALATQAAVDAALANYRVGLWNTEMGEDEIVDRILAAKSGVGGGDLRAGGLTHGQLGRVMDAGARLADIPLFLDDTPDLSVADLRAKARHAKRLLGGLDLVVVDYLQIMRAEKADNRTQAVSDMSRGLKILAKDLRVPVVVLSQLSRQLEQRPGVDGKRPVLSDLRDSGAIEQDADGVMFLFRASYYDDDKRPEFGPDVTDIAIPKLRGGAPVPWERCLSFDWDGARTRFADRGTLEVAA